MDVGLAGGDDGVQLGSELTSRYGTLVLYATGNPGQVRERADAGLLVVIEKPYSIEMVVTGIRTAQQLGSPAF